MDRGVELELIDELRSLAATRSFFLDGTVTQSPVEQYLDETRFTREREAIMRRLPQAAAHVSELAGPGAFLRCDVHGLPVLLTRDRQGAAHAFLNACRHRGARLVEVASGCAHRFTCPYHGWTYANSGPLVGAPHFESGFGGIDKTGIGLKPLPVHEAFGFVWVAGDPGGGFDFDGYFTPLADELDALGMAAMTIAAEDRMVCNANWKLLIEGGIESYHFRVAHRDTIAPYFEDNLSGYRGLGPHLRSVLPRTGMAALTETSRDGWRMRDHANLVYTLFPTTQLLVQQDHVVWIRQEPLAPGRTSLRLATFAPTGSEPGEGKGDDHWRRNHAITIKTLEEDIRIGEGIHAGLASGANDHFLFGRFEGALDRFNQTVMEHLDTAATRKPA
jgi:phenylpropionate dioxygenase-like ring-hydroxylating dioxygenase large terminal subunit